MSQRDKALLVQLYSSIVGKPVPQSDLFTAGGAYEPNNKHNQQHAIHLLQINNTLRAEIDISAQATIIRKQPASHDPITDANDLIDCSGFGAKQRHSDPHIGDVVNTVARQGCSLTLARIRLVSTLKSCRIRPPISGIKKPDGGVVGIGLLEEGARRRRSYSACRIRGSGRPTCGRRSPDWRREGSRPAVRS